MGTNVHNHGQASPCGCANASQAAASEASYAVAETRFAEDVESGLPGELFTENLAFEQGPLFEDGSDFQTETDFEAQADFEVEASPEDVSLEADAGLVENMENADFENTFEQPELHSGALEAASAPRAPQRPPARTNSPSTSSSNRPPAGGARTSGSGSAGAAATRPTSNSAGRAGGGTPNAATGRPSGSPTRGTQTAADGTRPASGSNSGRPPTSAGGTGAARPPTSAGGTGTGRPPSGSTAAGQNATRPGQTTGTPSAGAQGNTQGNAQSNRAGQSSAGSGSPSGRTQGSASNPSGSIVDGLRQAIEIGTQGASLIRDLARPFTGSPGPASPPQNQGSPDPVNSQAAPQTMSTAQGAPAGSNVQGLGANADAPQGTTDTPPAAMQSAQPTVPEPVAEPTNATAPSPTDPQPTPAASPGVQSMNPLQPVPPSASNATAQARPQLQAQPPFQAPQLQAQPQPQLQPQQFQAQPQFQAQAQPQFQAQQFQAQPQLHAQPTSASGAPAFSNVYPPPFVPSAPGMPIPMTQAGFPPAHAASAQPPPWGMNPYAASAGMPFAASPFPGAVPSPHALAGLLASGYPRALGQTAPYATGSMAGWLGALQSGQVPSLASLGSGAIPAAMFPRGLPAQYRHPNFPAPTTMSAPATRDATALLSMILRNPALQSSLQQAAASGPNTVDLAIPASATSARASTVPIPIDAVLQTIASLAGRSMMEMSESNFETESEDVEAVPEYLLTESGDLLVDPTDPERRVDLVTLYFRCATEAEPTGHYENRDEDWQQRSEVNPW